MSRVVTTGQKVSAVVTSGQKVSAAEQPTHRNNNHSAKVVAT